jgi:asparagine synthase (glutamine-hydrolysing)
MKLRSPMCGINGILFKTQQPSDYRDKIKQMNQALAHRGPDDDSLWHDDYCFLGHRRLSIIDLSKESNQPMQSFDGRFMIVYNGELYNYRELKLELQRVSLQQDQKDIASYFFQTQSDTEVVLAAYMRWGVECLKHFNGMFAFAIYDRDKRQLFMARDRMGVKPFYYHLTSEHIAFSSEIRALMASEVMPRKINLSALSDYVRYQTVFAPDTIIKDIQMLMPGYYAMIEFGTNTTVVMNQYWDLSKNAVSIPKRTSYEQIKKHVLSLTERAVERRLVSDVPFGAFLSGGVDSSAVVALMSKTLSQPVNTFAITFKEDEFSEAPYSRLIAKKYKTNHHEIELSVNDFLNDLPSALNAIDHPSADGPNTYMVSKAVRKSEIKMALSGLGGDELFAGYPTFKQYFKIKNSTALKLFPTGLKSLGASVMHATSKSTKTEKLKEISKLSQFNLNSVYPNIRKVFSEESIQKFLKEEAYHPSNIGASLKDIQNRENHQVRTVSEAEMKTYMQNILLRDADQMSMAHALEVRLPFMDYALIEYVLALSDDYKFISSPKRLLIESMGDLLPEEIWRRKKMGFVLPYERWMKQELKQFCEDKIRSLSSRSFMNEAYLNGLWDEFLKGTKRVNWSRMWQFVVLENWLQKNNIEH